MHHDENNHVLFHNVLKVVKIIHHLYIAFAGFLQSFQLLRW